MQDRPLFRSFVGDRLPGDVTAASLPVLTALSPDQLVDRVRATIRARCPCQHREDDVRWWSLIEPAVVADGGAKSDQHRLERIVGP
jgi:hypothetical protein